MVFDVLVCRRRTHDCSSLVWVPHSCLRLFSAVYDLQRKIDAISKYKRGGRLAQSRRRNTTRREVGCNFNRPRVASIDASCEREIEADVSNTFIVFYAENPTEKSLKIYLESHC